MNDTTVGQIIELRCEKIGISTQELERRLEFKSGYISKIDKPMWGDRQGDLIKIADALWLDSDALIISSGEIPRRVRNLLESHPQCIGLLKAHIKQYESRLAPMDNKSKKGAK